MKENINKGRKVTLLIHSWCFSIYLGRKARYIRRNQKDLRLEIYQNIKDTIVRDDVDDNAIGKKNHFAIKFY